MAWLMVKICGTLSVHCRRRANRRPPAIRRVLPLPDFPHFCIYLRDWRHWLPIGPQDARGGHCQSRLGKTLTRRKCGAARRATEAVCLPRQPKRHMASVALRAAPHFLRVKVLRIREQHGQCGRCAAAAGMAGPDRCANVRTTAPLVGKAVVPLRRTAGRLKQHRASSVKHGVVAGVDHSHRRSIRILRHGFLQVGFSFLPGDRSAAGIRDHVTSTPSRTMSSANSVRRRPGGSK